MKKMLQLMKESNDAPSININKSFSLLSLKRLFIVAICVLLVSGTTHAQVINEGFEEAAWLSAVSNTANSSTTSGSVFIGASSASSTMTYYITNSSTSSYSSSITSTGTKSTTSSRYTSTLTSTGLDTCPNSGTWWYSRGNTSSDTKMVKVHSASHSWEIGGGGYLITPVIPAGITTVTCWISASSNFFIGANTATANVPIMNYNSTSTTNGFTYGLQTFASAANTTIQSFSYSTFISNVAQIGFFNKGNNNLLIDDIVINVNPGTQGTVTTGTNSNVTYTTAVITGTITNSNPVPAIIISSGICYSNAFSLPDTSGPYTTDGPSGVAAGSISSTITGLIPGMYCCARAYAITTAGIIYGNTTTCFNTKVPTTPTITTNPVNGLSSVAATSGGNISDSGGLRIDSSGVCWNTTGSPTVADNITKDGNSTNYSSLIAGLFPCTKYYVRAYAANKKGIVYGNQLSFTTACVPSLLASPAALNFGLVPIGTADTLSYVLTGALLTPAAGTVMVVAPAGCLISIPGVKASDTLYLPYTGSALPPTRITVSFTPSVYGYVNDSVRHSGGGTVPPNIQQVSISGLGSQPSNVYSNVGIDFWTGFGFVEEMSSNKANMSVYIAAGDQDAVVNVDIPGLGWSYQYNPINIKAHTVYEVTGFPKAAPQDSRLYYTGTSNRAVHVQSASGVPVSVWTYTSAPDNTAAGCMNFPTNVWNSQYTVQAFGGFSNEQTPNSYFFVIAKQDNTLVTITPTANIVDSTANTIFKDNTASYVKYPAGVPFNITLNKGQVFTGLSTLAGTGRGISSGNAFAADLSGTKITTDCKNKIAVFGGNGRCLVDTSTIPNPPNFQTVNASSGSDNMMQQMFPNSAWGTRYLTVPTKTMEDNYYRIYVQDSTATKVTVNGVLLNPNNLINKLYYQLSGSNLNTGDVKPYDTAANHFLEISATNAISVSQFIVASAISNNKGGNATSIGNNGQGDPEMIILSPIQQSINSVTVATPSFKNGLNGGNYINVVIPKNGVKSFRIYSDTTHLSWIQWRHTMDSAYTADPVNNLPFDPTNLYNLGTYSYKRFDTATMLVDTGASSYIAGVAYNSSNTLIYMDSAFQPYPTDSNYSFAKFKVTIGNSYTMYSDSGFNAIAYGMDAGESYGFNAGTNLKVINIPLGQPHLLSNIDTLKNYHVVPQDGTVTINSCLSIPSHFTLGLSFKPDSLVWSFDVNGIPNPYINPNQHVLQIAPVMDSTHIYAGSDTTMYYYYTLKDATGNPIKYTYSQLGTYPVKVVAYVKTSGISFADPCKVDTTHGVATVTYNFNVVVTKGVHPGFTPQYVSCTSDTTFKFVDNSWDENSGGDTAFIIGRIWSFGNNKSDTANKKSITTSYTTSGVYALRLLAIDKIGCIFDTTVNQSVKLKPIANFSVSTDTICAGSSVTFIDHSTSIGKGVLDKMSTWAWDYGNGKNTFTDSTRKSNLYQTAGIYSVSLKVTNGVGCDSSYTFKNVYVSANPVPDFSASMDVCLNAATTFTNLSTIAYGHSLNYIWDFGDTTKLDSTIFTKDSAVANHFYNGNGAYNVTLTAYNIYLNNLTCSASKTKSLDVLYTLIPLQVDSIYHEGFEVSALNHNPHYFPPVAAGGQRWHIYPTNSSTYTSTWTRDSINNIVPSEANASAWAHNYGTSVKQVDDLNTPVFGIPKYDSKNDSMFLKFDVAAKTNFSSGGSNRDTLEVLISSKCNTNWVSIYKKWGAGLQTFHDASVSTPGEFKVNSKSQWRTDSINITALHDTLGVNFSTMIQNGDSVRFKFRNHNNNENNIYIDNTDLYVNVDKGQGFITTTIPFDTALVLHDYDFRNLKTITIYDMAGRLLYHVNYNSNINNSYTSPRISIRPGYNGIPYMSNGMYVVVMTYSDRSRRVFNFLKQ